MLHRTSRSRLSLGPFLIALLAALWSAQATAAPSPSNGRLRLHLETDAFAFTHENPDGDGDNTNSFGFGFGHTTGPDSTVEPAVWAIGIGYKLIANQPLELMLGARVSFAFDTTKNDDSGPVEDDQDTRTTRVGGQLEPYVRLLFSPGKRVRPYAEARLGVIGYTTVSRVEDTDIQTTVNRVGPIVGAGGGAHIFLLSALSLDLGLHFDYIAPHVRAEVRNEDMSTEDDYDKESDWINLAARLGLSVWF